MREEMKDVDVPVEETNLEVYGAKVHNLKDINLVIPRDQLVVITGLSGSGKSSLAFDTIYAEGQRRYMETFSAYARQFIGNMERPEVDKITGLSPVISIEQKTTSKNPRSTVGTVTEIYDFMRLLYARVADAYSYNTGKKMVQYSDDQIIELLLKDYMGAKTMLLAPVVKGRKGHYRELFEQFRKQGYTKARIDGEVSELEFGMKLDRYKVHDIELVVDRIIIKEDSRERLSKSMQTAMQLAKGNMMVLRMDNDEVRHFSRQLMCVDTGISYNEPEPNTFSFNSPYGACPKCNGLGKITEIDIDKVFPNKNMTVKDGGIAPLGKANRSWVFKQVEGILQSKGFTMDNTIGELSDEVIQLLLNGSDEMVTTKNEFLGITDTYRLNFEGLIDYVLNQDQDTVAKNINKWIGKFTNKVECPECKGTRLAKESLYFKIDNKTIAEAASMDLSDLHQWLGEVEDRIDERKKIIAKEILREIRTRIQFLVDVGIDYLNLNRTARSLSGGESQRIRLATQIGSQLTGVLYILDEPSIGLHYRDNRKLIKALQDLRDIGNSVIVVEHDEDMMREADHIVDIGPGAGRLGGEIVAQGNLDAIMNSDSITSQYLNGVRKIEVPAKRRKGSGEALVLKGAKGNNLKNVNLTLPLGKLVVVTGVSGSGKSTLINETLYPILSKHFYRSEKEPLAYGSIKGLEHIDKVIEIDQSPIGRTPRSNPATYTGVFGEIRNLYAGLPESKIRGYKPGRFSFNVKGGRCETCQGAGLKVIEMNFLPDVHIHCDECYGKRYNRETLEVRFKGKSINDVLDMTINQAVEFFEHIPKILRKIKTLQDVGLGYITLGQQSTTLSGGEAQRIKLATELSKRDTGKTLYILDEPTTGLHFYDVQVLMNVIDKLVNKGNTVTIIEHNPDVIKLADHIVDLGPDGGREGGKILAYGNPEELAAKEKGYTADMLREILPKS